VSRGGGRNGTDVPGTPPPRRRQAGEIAPAAVAEEEEEESPPQTDSSSPPRRKQKKKKSPQNDSFLASLNLTQSFLSVDTGGLDLLVEDAENELMALLGRRGTSVHHRAAATWTAPSSPPDGGHVAVLSPISLFDYGCSPSSSQLSGVFAESPESGNHLFAVPLPHLDHAATWPVGLGDGDGVSTTSPVVNGKRRSDRSCSGNVESNGADGEVKHPSVIDDDDDEQQTEKADDGEEGDSLGPADDAAAAGDRGSEAGRTEDGDSSLRAAAGPLGPRAGDSSSDAAENAGGGVARADKSPDDDDGTKDGTSQNGGGGGDAGTTGDVAVDATVECSDSQDARTAEEAAADDAVRTEQDGGFGSKSDPSDGGTKNIRAGDGKLAATMEHPALIEGVEETASGKDSPRSPEVAIVADAGGEINHVDAQVVDQIAEKVNLSVRKENMGSGEVNGHTFHELVEREHYEPTADVNAATSSTRDVEGSPDNSETAASPKQTASSLLKSDILPSDTIRNVLTLHSPETVQMGNNDTKGEGSGMEMSKSEENVDSHFVQLTQYDEEEPDGVAAQPKAIPNAEDARRAEDSRQAVRGLQVELPSALDTSRGSKRNDAVSLSSASSTISHCSTTRGVFSTEMISSPSNTDDASLRRCRTVEARPPLFPKRDKGMQGSPRSFVESVSRRLLRDGSKEMDDGSERVRSRWIKQPTSFNPMNSIFASKKDDSDSQSISSPGSPPEPIYPWFEEEISSSQSEESSFPEEFVHVAELPETSSWDVASGSMRTTSLHGGLDGRPDFVVTTTPFGDPTISAPDELGESLTERSSRHSMRKSSLLAGGVPQPRRDRNRRGLLRTLSRSTRGSDRHSLGSRSSRARSFRSLSAADSRVPTALPLLSPQRDCRDKVIRKSQSLPDLQSIDESLSPVRNRISVDYQDVSARTQIETRPRNDLAIAGHPSTAIPLPDNASLEKELVAFSSVGKIEIPFRYQKRFPSLDYLGSVRWHQLLACWKHSEMIRTMTARRVSPHFLAHSCDEGSYDSRAFTFNHGVRVVDEALELEGVIFGENKVRLECKNLDGFSPQDSELTVTRFLSRVGRWIQCDATATSGALRHELSSKEATIRDLVRAAESTLDQFLSIVQEMASFASHQNEPLRQDSQKSKLQFSVNVKDEERIREKAELKYCGDILRVKDVLRAQIVFPDEGSLVCGLLCLQRLREPSEEKMEEDRSAFRVVRIKNLFASESHLGSLQSSPLPTGYRHVLLNIRFGSGLLGGKFLFLYFRLTHVIFLNSHLALTYYEQKSSVISLLSGTFLATRDLSCIAIFLRSSILVQKKRAPMAKDST
jgi:hypothetical protein